MKPIIIFLFSLILALASCDRRNPTDSGYAPVIQVFPKDPVDSVIIFPFQATAANPTPRDYVEIRASVSENGGLLADGVNIHFTAQYGTVSGVSATINGFATASFFPRQQNLSYIETITAYMTYNNGEDTSKSEMKIRVVPAQNTNVVKVGAIVLSASPTTVQILGTGGYDQSTVIAKVSDEQRNNVNDGTPIFFEIFNGPRSGERLEKDTGYTANGEAKVTFRSGSKPGIVVIRASSGSISVQQSLITITSGPPQNISINPILTPIKLETGSSQWIMYLHAKLTDANLNEVQDGWAVSFAVDTSFHYKILPDTTTRLTEIEGLSINSGSETGRRFQTANDVLLASLPGIAETYIKFPVSSIFDSLKIRATTLVGQTEITTSKVIGFPLPADGLTLSIASLSGISAIVETEYSKDTAHIQATLLFGQSPISNARIRIEPASGDIIPTTRCTASGICSTDNGGHADFQILFADKHRPSDNERSFTADMRVIVMDQPGITPQTLTLTLLFTY